MYKTKCHIHFVGIGGIGMSGIATILKLQGYEISGCDADLAQKSIISLKELGCSIYEGNNTPSCHDRSIDILVYSSAINPHNPEIIGAQCRGIPTISRALMLAELMRTKFSIAVAGSHGKTTTTSLISHILIEAALDPTVIIGGHLKSISSNARMGEGDFLVAEADESDKSLAKLSATLAVITNIDLDHVDAYKDLDDVKETFKTFLNNIPFYGKAIMCNEDPHIRSLLPMPHLKIIKYGLDSQSHIYATHITLEGDYSEYRVYNSVTNSCLGSVRLAMPGIHNVLNSLAALTVSLDVGVSFNVIQHALSTFKGVDRRFTYKGTYKHAEIFDDYGHHPQEIYHTLLTARRRAKGKLIVIFEPHRFTRFTALFNDFLNTFLKVAPDVLIVTDVYTAGEHMDLPCTSAEFVKALQHQNSPFAVYYAPFNGSYEHIHRYVDTHLNEHDLILLLGAGKVTYMAAYLLNLAA